MTHLHLAVPFAPDLPEQTALESALDGITLDVTPETALLVLTEDAGSATAARFYADALATGPALASPAAFPWCLANAPCATIARRFGLTGPNVTWLVDSLDRPEGFAPAAAWLDGATSRAVVVAIRFSRPSPRLVVWRWSPADGPVSERLMRADWCAAACLDAA